MSDLVNFLKKLSPDTLGEALRSITFVGEGLGPYNNFNVRKDAYKWTGERCIRTVNKIFHEDFAEENVTCGHGYTFKESTLEVDIFMVSDGDTTLYFGVWENGTRIREVINTDAKCPWDWEEYDSKGRFL